jgi:hypothetical protein
LSLRRDLQEIAMANPDAPSIGATALRKIGDRGQIKETIIDGLRALDNAINPEAVKIDSPVASRANVLMALDREAGNVDLRLLWPVEAAGAGPIFPLARRQRARARRRVRPRPEAADRALAAFRRGLQPRCSDGRC